MPRRTIGFNAQQAEVIDKALKRLETTMIERVSVRRTTVGVESIIPEFGTSLKQVHAIRDMIAKWM